LPIGIIAFGQSFSYIRFGEAEYTPARQNANKFAFANAYAYI